MREWNGILDAHANKFDFRCELLRASGLIELDKCFDNADGGGTESADCDLVDWISVYRCDEVVRDLVVKRERKSTLC